MPMPISSRLAPVMFARAREHGDSPPPSMGTDGKSHRGRTAGGCEHKGTVATGLTPGTGGVLQPPENAPTGGVKPSPVTPGQTQR